MGSDRFYMALVVQCLLIFMSAFLCFYFLQVRQQPNTALGMAVLGVLLTLRLIYHVNKTNRILAYFFSYMREKDPSLHYSARYVEKNFRGIHGSLEKLIRELKENRIELEIQAHYLKSILDNVSTGIMCFDPGGQIRIMNRAAVEYLESGKISYLNELNGFHGALGNKILDMRPGELITEAIIKRGGRKYLSIHATQIKLKKERIHIIAINDITHQMEEQEVLSWKKLIRVINHEIMNSMTPIITLAMAIRKKIAYSQREQKQAVPATDALQDAIQSVTIIEERSKGLVAFIERYKKLTDLPPMKMERFPAGKIFEKIEQLFRVEFEEKGIRLKSASNCHLDLLADRQMLEQVLINLIKNSVEATHNTEDPEIGLKCSPEGESHIGLSVSDNGEGIPRDKLDQVFVPFYTTREDGSGIGLSLCRQIIRSHHGKMEIESEPGKGTRVLILLMRDPPG